MSGVTADFYEDGVDVETIECVEIDTSARRATFEFEFQNGKQGKLVTTYDVEFKSCPLLRLRRDSPIVHQPVESETGERTGWVEKQIAWTSDVSSEMMDAIRDGFINQEEKICDAHQITDFKFFGQSL